MRTATLRESQQVHERQEFLLQHCGESSYQRELMAQALPFPLAVNSSKKIVAVVVEFD